MSTSTAYRARFGRNVRHVRRAKGLSQEKFAFACHLHRNYIGSIERGERNVSIDSMARVATTLGIDLADLLRVAKDVQP